MNNLELDKIAFGAGCFWHVEEEFSKLNGVKKTTVGYMGGELEHPTYEDVCTDKTGHIEVVEVEFDQKLLPLKKLLSVFFSIHNPTTLNRQGPDIGTQYQSAIFYYTQKQKAEAEKFIKELEEKRSFTQRKIVTTIRKAEEFWPAEEYHQKYYKKNKIKTCRII